MHKTTAKARWHAPPHQRREEANDALSAHLAQDLAKSLLITLGVGFALILIASLSAYFSPDPDKLIRPLALLSVGMTAFLGGTIATRIHGGGALMCGLLNGSMLLILMIPLSLCFSKYASGYSAGVSVLLHLGVAVLSVAGGYLGVKKKTGKRRKSK